VPIFQPSYIVFLIYVSEGYYFFWRELQTRFALHIYISLLLLQKNLNYCYSFLPNRRFRLIL